MYMYIYKTRGCCMRATANIVAHLSLSLSCSVCKCVCVCLYVEQGDIIAVTTVITRATSFSRLRAAPPPIPPPSSTPRSSFLSSPSSALFPFSLVRFLITVPYTSYTRQELLTKKLGEGGGCNYRLGGIVLLSSIKKKLSS